MTFTKNQMPSEDTVDKSNRMIEHAERTGRQFLKLPADASPEQVRRRLHELAESARKG